MLFYRVQTVPKFVLAWYCCTSWYHPDVVLPSTDGSEVCSCIVLLYKLVSSRCCSTEYSRFRSLFLHSTVVQASIIPMLSYRVQTVPKFVLAWYCCTNWYHPGVVLPSTVGSEVCSCIVLLHKLVSSRCCSTEYRRFRSLFLHSTVVQAGIIPMLFYRVQTVPKFVLAWYCCTNWYHPDGVLPSTDGSEVCSCIVLLYKLVSSRCCPTEYRRFRSLFLHSTVVQTGIIPMLFYRVQAVPKFVLA